MTLQKKNNDELQGLSDQELIARLKWEDIPDTRQIQKERIESIGVTNQYEKSMQRFELEYPRDTRFSATKRLVLLPEEQLREVYSLAIPLAVPLGDFSVKTNPYHRWTNGNSQKGAMHLTTPQGLERLLDIFRNNEITVKEEKMYGTLCDADANEMPKVGVVVPHSWFIAPLGDGEALFEHQFVVAEYKVFVIPYVNIRGETVVARKREPILGSIFKEENTTTHYRRFEATGIPFCETHLPLAETAIRETYARRDKDALGERDDARVIEAQTFIAKIEKPVLIYDPAWIKV